MKDKEALGESVLVRAVKNGGDHNGAQAQTNPTSTFETWFRRRVREWPNWR